MVVHDFDIAGVAIPPLPNVRAIRKLGVLRKDQFDSMFSGLLRWLGHTVQQP